MNAHRQHHASRSHLFILFFAFFILYVSFCILTSPVYAVPETTAVRITDVTTSSFSVVWMTDVAANPSVEVYADSSMQQRVTEGVTITVMPAGSGKAAQAAQAKGIMKVRVSGVQPATSYYVRTVTQDPANPDSVAYSALQQVTTASVVTLYGIVNSAQQGVANDLMAFSVYIRPIDMTTEPGLGDLIILEDQGSSYPVSAFVGDGTLSPEGILDLNNLFREDGTSLNIISNEVITLRIYRAGNLSTLTHYRRTPQNTNLVSVVSPLGGFFADINLDGKVDDQDFQLFKAQYRTAPNDGTYNPDYNFVDDADGKVDVREFGKFSKEYGRTDVQ